MKEVNFILILQGKSLIPNEIKDIDISMYYNQIGDKSNLDVISNLNKNAQHYIQWSDKEIVYTLEMLNIK